MTRRGTERLIYLLQFCVEPQFVTIKILSPSLVENEGGERLEERVLEVNGWSVRGPCNSSFWAVERGRVPKVSGFTNTAKQGL